MVEDKDQPRLLLAFALSALVLLLFAPKQFRGKPATQPPGQSKAAPTKPDATKPGATKPGATKPGATKPDTTKPDAATPAAPASASRSKKSAPAPVPSVAAMAASQESDLIVSSDLYDVHLTNRGGVATNWVLKKFKDDNGLALDVVNPLDVAHTG